MPLVDIAYIDDETLPEAVLVPYLEKSRQVLCEVFGVQPIQVMMLTRRVPPGESHLALDAAGRRLLVIQVTLRSGFSSAEHELCHERLAAAAVEELGWDLAAVRTWIDVVDPLNWGIGGRSMLEISGAGA